MTRCAALLGGLWFAIGCAAIRPAGPVVVSDGRYAMGTVLEITLVASGETAGRAALSELFALAERLDRAFTVFDTESPVSQLNRAAGRGPQTVDAELGALLARVRAHAELTRGAFDATVGPLVALWTEAAARDVPPTEAEIAARLARVGWEKVRVGGDGRVALDGAGVSVDLGGVAKGWALDGMLAVLEVQDLTIAVGFYVVFLLSVTAHEAAHALAALKLGNRLARAARGLAAAAAPLRAALEALLARAGTADDPWVGERLRWLREALESGLEGSELDAAYRAAFPGLPSAAD